MAKNPPDVVVYRDSSGGARVSPGVFYVSKKLKNKVFIINGTNEKISIQFFRAKRKRFLDRFGDEAEIDVINFPEGATFYTVIVGNDIAQGNSAPALIIDG